MTRKLKECVKHTLEYRSCEDCESATRILCNANIRSIVKVKTNNKGESYKYMIVGCHEEGYIINDYFNEDHDANL